jgi:plastocyanin
MRPILRGLSTLAIAAALAACSGSTPGPTSGSGATQSTGGGATQVAGGAAPCADTTETTVVNAGIANRAFDPATINAKIGDVITWKNSDTVAHGVELDDSSCKQANAIAPGASGSLKFTKSGTFPFHCFIHPSMKGTIVVA